VTVRHENEETDKRRTEAAKMRTLKRTGGYTQLEKL
jgi:hypothetical protein